MSGFLDEPEPHVDRFANSTATRKEQASFVELDGFEPTDLATEAASRGWLRTTAPEGVPLDGLPDIITSGSRGDEGLRAKTVGRTRANRPDGADWDSGAMAG